MNSYSMPGSPLTEAPRFLKTPEHCAEGIPSYGDLIKAGFPSPAADYREEVLDFNSYLIKNSAATFTVRVEGDSMEGEGIRSGDLLIVDRSIPPRDNTIVVAVLYGEFTVKRLVRREGRLWLCPGNPSYDPVRIELDMEFQVWGVVTHVIHSFLPGQKG
ncbi:MAG: translesion error-prone DNA polymerase V autoproteolytic subunit [Spirochaetales bacterium]|nr:translesion error-prone DNA polymerase V autoproteolytic subunit [Spirochaetales bacterium]